MPRLIDQLATGEQLTDHVREDDDVAQRPNRKVRLVDREGADLPVCLFEENECLLHIPNRGERQRQEWGDRFSQSRSRGRRGGDDGRA